MNEPGLLDPHPEYLDCCALSFEIPYTANRVNDKEDTALEVRFQDASHNKNIESVDVIVQDIEYDLPFSVPDQPGLTEAHASTVIITRLNHGRILGDTDDPRRVILHRIRTF